MELHCLPVETPTGSACSSDPIYDNCLPHAQSRKNRDRDMEHRVQQPTVQGPCSPRPGLVPALAVGAVTGEARGPGLWPDHSYCSWRAVLGRPGYGAEQGARGGDSEQAILWRAQDRGPGKRSPSPSHSTEHRSALSFYDNIPEAVTPDSLPVFAMDTQEHMYQAWAPPQDPEPEPEEESLERSPWSSCEIVLPEFKDPELCSQVCQTEPWPTEEAQERLPPPVPVADPSASALRSLLTSLQQQIVRQRDEYEQRISSLEHRNGELQVEVIRLKSSLAQQRHWYQVAQAKILESERARAAAEQRNATLQRDMEQFFDTFGELNKEAKKTEYIAKSF